jgi:hypothetical protein
MTAPYLQRSTVSYFAGSHYSHLVSWNAFPGDEIVIQPRPHSHIGYARPFLFHDGASYKWGYSIELINTQYRCDYTRVHERHVVTCSRQSASCLQTVEAQGCQLHRKKEWSLSNTTWHLVTFQNEFRDKFPDPPVPNMSTISRLVNRFRDTGTLHRVASIMRKRVNACIVERGGHFQHLI